MGKSVLDAIQAGDWNFEPQKLGDTAEFRPTDAVPGSPEKLAILAQRIRLGFPLWHPQDLHAEDVLRPTELGLTTFATSQSPAEPAS